MKKTNKPFRPAVLYHASPNKNIEIFEPRNIKTRDPDEGPVLFTTPDKALAAAFLVRTDGSWVKIGRFTIGEKVTKWHVVANSRRKFEKLDKGGAIYSFSPEGFRSYKKRGLGDMEWTTKERTRPIKKEVHRSGIKTMKQLGVELYFVNRRTFRRISRAEDHGREIIKTLKKEN